MSQKLVSIIVLTYNSEKVLQTCLKSIFNQTYENYEVVIVDNNSNDGTKNFLANYEFPKNKIIKTILNTKNYGYNSGNKIGIDNVKGELIALINPDIRLEKDWLEKIVNSLEESNYVISSGKILNQDGTIQSNGGLIDVYGASTQRKKIISKKENKFFYNPGMAIILKKKLLENVKLDTNIFMYYDDVDLSWRARLNGYNLQYCNDAIAYHKSGDSLPGLPPSKFFQISKNRLYVCIKNFSRNRILKRILIIVFLIFLDSIYYSIKKKSIGYFFMFFRSIGWNIKNSKNIIKERKKIQSDRKISDNEIEKYMLKKSIELKHFNKNHE